MEENHIEVVEITEISNKVNDQKSQKPIVSAIIVAAILIAGAILLRGSKAPEKTIPPPEQYTTPSITLAPVGLEDIAIGNREAEVALVMYEDFQCHYCGKIFKESEKTIRDTYVKDGKVLFVYRDYAFLGSESVRSAEAARCANDQEKFWTYHDYLLENQSEGSFTDANLKSFAKKLGLDSTSFDKCLDSKKYEQAITDAKNEATNAGVTGTPKGFVLRDGKIVDTIEGAEPFTTIKQKLDNALK